MNGKEHRIIDGQISARMGEGAGARFRVSAPLTMSRDSDGSWLVYSTLGDKLDETSASVEINDPAACAAMDALFELIADPQAFEGRTIGERANEGTEAA